MLAVPQCLHACLLTCYMFKSCMNSLEKKRKSYAARRDNGNAHRLET